MFTTRSNICHDIVCVIITRCCHPPPVPGYRMSWPAHGLRNNNIKCLLSLSRKTNLIIRSANKSLASNMVLIFRLSLSKVNTRVVSQLGNAEHSRVFISRPVLRKFHHPQSVSVCVPNPGCAGNIPIMMVVSLVISWPPPSHLITRAPGSQILPSNCGRN